LYQKWVNGESGNIKIIYFVGANIRVRFQYST